MTRSVVRLDISKAIRRFGSVLVIKDAQKEEAAMMRRKGKPEALRSAASERAGARATPQSDRAIIAA